MAENFLIIAQQVLVLFILIGVGFLCGKKGMIDEHSAKKMTDIVLYAVTPCVMISAFQREFSPELVSKIIIAAACAVLIHAGSILIAKAVFRSKDESRKKVLQFAVVFSNCGFMSLPLQKAILGDDGWFYGSIFVAVFNIFMWTYGLVSMSGDRKQLSIKKLVFNPGLAGVVVALVLFLCQITLPDILSKPVDYLAALNTPLPMLIIGYYLSKANFKKAFSDGGVYAAMCVRMMLIPLLSLLAMTLFKIDSTIVVAFIIASSAPTAAATTMFSAKYDRDVELSVGAVAAATVVSIVTMPIVTALAQTISR